MHGWIAATLIIVTSPTWALDAIIKDGDTLRLGDTSYRLDGVDAPEFDQTCLDENGAVWKCGIETRDRLTAFIAGRLVHCEDKGADSAYPKRRIGICRIDGEPITLNQWLVREGWALNFEPYAKRRFVADQDRAGAERRGLWKGCFAAPQDLRRWNKTTSKLLGPSCFNVRDTDARNALFLDDPNMPQDCSIKGTFSWRAKATGHRGIYHLEGCRSYRSTQNVKRWFCDEEDAQAAGFRKAFNC